MNKEEEEGGTGGAGGKREKTVRQNGETMKKGEAGANEMRSALRSRISGGGQEGRNKGEKKAQRQGKDMKEENQKVHKELLRTQDGNKMRKREEKNTSHRGRFPLLAASPQRRFVGAICGPLGFFFHEGEFEQLHYL